MKFRLLLMGLAVSLCSGLSAQSWEPTATVFIDGTVLYGTSEYGVLRADLKTGAITLVDTSGGVQEFQSSDSLVDRAIKADSLGLRFIAGPSIASSLAPSSARCSIEASTLQAAITLAQRACANDPSSTCSAAVTALHNAYDDYVSCINTFQQER